MCFICLLASAKPPCPVKMREASLMLAQAGPSLPKRQDSSLHPAAGLSLSHAGELRGSRGRAGSCAPMLTCRKQSKAEAGRTWP